jgi:hypothetical protein
MGLLVLRGRRRLGTLMGISLLWGLLWYALAGPAHPLIAAPADSIVIVTSQLYPVATLTKTDVREIYLGHRMIEQFLRIRPIDQSDPAIRTAFLQSVLNVSKEAYIDHWNRLLFQQGGLPPLLKDSPNAVIKELLNTDGSIGYLWGQDAAGQNGLKVLLVIPLK